MMSKELQQLGQLLSEGTFAAAISPSSPLVEQFAAYYALVLKWNPVLHLTTLTTPLEFYQRHLQEAFFLADYLAPTATSVFDLGAGLGVPGIPLAILRPDLQVVLVEASHKKAIFLEEVADRLNLDNVRVRSCRLESINTLSAHTVLTARAIDKMTLLVPQILQLSSQALQLLLLGGVELIAQLERHLLPPGKVETYLLPQSTARYLLEVRRFT